MFETPPAQIANQAVADVVRDALAENPLIASDALCQMAEAAATAIAAGFAVLRKDVPPAAEAS